MVVSKLMAIAKANNKTDTKTAILRPNFLFANKKPLTKPKMIRVIVVRPMIVNKKSFI